MVRVEGQLYALDDAGTRTPIAKIRAIASNPSVDLLPLADSTYSFADTTAKVPLMTSPNTKAIVKKRRSVGMMDCSFTGWLGNFHVVGGCCHRAGVDIEVAGGGAFGDICLSGPSG